MAHNGFKNNFLSLEQNQVALLRSDYSTGHILDIYCNLYNCIKDNEEIYSIFDSLESAKNHITEEKQKYKTIEYLIYGKTQEVLYYDTPYVKA